MSKTILVVDDNESVMRLLHDGLSQAGFRVVVARNGHEGLLVADLEVPDLILLNVVMPTMNGYDFLRAFRLENNTPIILVTAKTEETDITFGLELGADDYVTKPFSIVELIARIHANIGRADENASSD